MAIENLHNIRSERALPTLKKHIYRFSSNLNIAKKTRDAILHIEIKSRLLKIEDADSEEIEWAKDFFATSSGTKQQYKLEIVQAFEQAILTDDSVGTDLVNFIQSEIDSGYHDYDQEISEAMIDFVQ